MCDGPKIWFKLCRIYGFILEPSKGNKIQQSFVSMQYFTMPEEDLKLHIRCHSIQQIYKWWFSRAEWGSGSDLRRLLLGLIVDRLDNKILDSYKKQGNSLEELSEKKRLIYVNFEKTNIYTGLHHVVYFDC